MENAISNLKPDIGENKYSIANSYSAANQFLDAYHRSLSHQQLQSPTDPLSHHDSPMNLMSLGLNDSNQVSVGNTQTSIDSGPLNMSEHLSTTQLNVTHLPISVPSMLQLIHIQSH